MAETIDFLELENTKPKFEDIESSDGYFDEVPEDEATIPASGVHPKPKKKRLDLAKLAPAKVTKRDTKEVSQRLTSMLQGGTGIASLIRPSLQMTDQEAKDIADPLSTYLCRQEFASEHVRDFLDNYDLIAVALATLTYLVRVYKDEQDARAKQRIDNPTNRRTLPVRTDATPSNERQSGPVGEPENPDVPGGAETDGGLWVSAPYTPGV